MISKDGTGLSPETSTVKIGMQDKNLRYGTCHKTYGSQGFQVVISLREMTNLHRKPSVHRSDGRDTTHLTLDSATHA